MFLRQGYVCIRVQLVHNTVAYPTFRSKQEATRTVLLHPLNGIETDLFQVAFRCSSQ